MTGGSQQLRLFRRAIRDRLSVEVAAQQAGIEISEARLIMADDLRSPPAPEAYCLLGLSQTLVDLCGPWGRRA